jgi:hypothetical protein
LDDGKLENAWLKEGKRLGRVAGLDALRSWSGLGRAPGCLRLIRGEKANVSEGILVYGALYTEYNASRVRRQRCDFRKLEETEVK